MSRNYSLLRLFSASICCLVGIAAHEAIIGGLKAPPLEMRYQATIFIHGQASSCGGGIISKYAILTAAHCIIAYGGELIGKPIYVLVGTHDLSVPGVTVAVEKVFIPKEFSSQYPHINADIAVLRLKKPLEMDKDNLKGLTLPNRKKLISFYDNRTAKIAGFGWDEMFENHDFIGEHTDHHLRFADTTVRSLVQCKRDHPNQNFTDKLLCARVKDTDLSHKRGVCFGDDGGPLVHRGLVVIGVLSSATINCSERTSSGIYTRVSSYGEFIDIAKDGIESWSMYSYNV